jgi:hypothetical protein
MLLQLLTGIEPHTMFMNRNHWCFSSYFIATKQFWLDYVKELRILKQRFDSLEGEARRIFHGSAGYDDPSLNYWPFFVERYFSTYLHLKMGSVTVDYYPYDYSHLLVFGYNEQWVNIFKTCSDIKMSGDVNRWSYFTNVVRTKLDYIGDP